MFFLNKTFKCVLKLQLLVNEKITVFLRRALHFLKFSYVYLIGIYIYYIHYIPNKIYILLFKTLNYYSAVYCLWVIQ